MSINLIRISIVYIQTISFLYEIWCYEISFSEFLGEKAIEIGEKYIETMVVVDKTFLEYHATTEDVKRYVLLLLKLVRIIYIYIQ